MTLQELKKHLENIYGFNLADRSRKRELVDARRIFSKIGFSLGYNLREIGEQIDRKHCNVIHLLDTVNLTTTTHKIIHDNLVKEYGLLSRLFNVNDVKQIQAQAARQRDDESLKVIKQITNTLMNWDTNSLNNFLQTRVKVYDKLIKTTKPQKPIQKVKGATLKRPVKNTLLG